ncbi:MAG: hypothetical protein CME62_17840 [Halobacteriovoraceae bacterium]|nr:hypothetical protein [Halobacteriovoraceae bacterium]|tara:strand:- start:13065 stop:13547 length:483 start_codon:yes stop_codon:yes gene_type:complete
MIINLKKKNLNFLQSLKSSCVYLFSHFLLSQKIIKIVEDSHYLTKFFYHKFPQLKKNVADQIKCVSCGSCEQVCPVAAIKIKKAGLLSLPQSLTSGEVPQSFELNLETCIKCHLCVDVCLVDAIGLNASYEDQSGIVDLVKFAENKTSSQKVESVEDVQN